MGLFPGEQYIFLVGLVKGEIFFQFVVSNPSSDVQKLFSVIRDGSSNIMYKISTTKKSYKQRKKMNKIALFCTVFYKSTDPRDNGHIGLYIADELKAVINDLGPQKVLHR